MGYNLFELSILEDFLQHNCDEGLQDHPYVWWLTSKTYRIQHMVLLTANIYYHKMYEVKLGKGKMYGVKSREIQE